jgi:rhodanese-related sulfurtransferase
MGRIGNASKNMKSYSIVEVAEEVAKLAIYLYARGFNVLNLVGGMLEWKTK